ncbi:MAG: hypothetical protein ACYTEQ_04640 [Planctomycetota bacterium]|jgi:hypothetical protein
MDANETAQKTPRKLKLSHVLIALLAAVIAAFVLFRVTINSRLRKKLDAIRAAGYPVTWAELDDWYALPDGAENAAAYLLEAFACCYKWNDRIAESLPIVGHAEFPPRTQPLAEESKPLIAAYLADNNEAVRLLHEGAAVEHCRYPVDLKRGLALVHHDLSEVRHGTQLLTLEAILHAENAEPDLALRSVISGLGLARSLSGEPILISQLVRIACQGLAVSNLERVLNRTDFTDEQLVSLAQAFSGIDLLTKATTEKLALVSVDFSPVLLLEIYRALGLLDMEALLYLDLMKASVEGNELPVPERQGAARAVDDQLDRLSKIHLFVRAFMPALARATELDLRVISHLRAAQVAVAVERYRLAAGRLPDALADLVPSYLDAVPEDPFDGKALRYKKLTPGFVVYSVGEDGSDDGGKERPKSRDRKADSSYDITFIIQR